MAVFRIYRYLSGKYHFLIYFAGGMGSGMQKWYLRKFDFSHSFVFDYSRISAPASRPSHIIQYRGAQCLLNAKVPDAGHGGCP